MTTKNKSLLGISYLSVAMLSASLLMTNPVSADEDGESQVHTIQLCREVIEGDSCKPIILVKDCVDCYDEEQYSNYRDSDPQEEGMKRGEVDGFAEGLISDSDLIPRREDITIPPKFDSETQSDDDYSSYNDGYILGFGLGFKNARDQLKNALIENQANSEEASIVSLAYNESEGQKEKELPSNTEETKNQFELLASDSQEPTIINNAGLLDILFDTFIEPLITLYYSLFG